MPWGLPGPARRVHPCRVVLIVPSMRMLLNDSPTRTPTQLGSVRPRPQRSWIHRPSTALLPCQKIPRGALQAPEGLSGRGRGARGSRGEMAGCSRHRDKGRTVCAGNRHDVPPALCTGRPGRGKLGKLGRNPPGYTASVRSCTNMRGTGSLTVGTPPSMGADQSSPLAPRLP